MKKSLPILALGLLMSVSLCAQTVILDNFNAGTATGSEVAGTSWVGQTTQNATTLTVGGSAKDDNGWGISNVSIDATGTSFLAVTAQVDSGNVAAQFSARFSDNALNSEILTISTSAFNVGSMSTVYIPVSWTSGIDVSNITGWSIGGGDVGTTAFHMTFDNLALTASAVPEPSTYALLAGIACLGFIVIRRRLAKA